MASRIYIYRRFSMVWKWRSSLSSDIRSIWPWRETLQVWRRLAESVTGKRVHIRLWTDQDAWRALSLARGIPIWHYSDGMVILTRGRYTIHLVLPKNNWIDSAFPTFLHEVGHIYLGHLPRTGRRYRDLELETNCWRSLNFTPEMNLVERFLSLERHGRKIPLSCLRRTVRGQKLDAMLARYGGRFHLAPSSKLPLSGWINGFRRGIDLYFSAQRLWDELSKKTLVVPPSAEYDLAKVDLTVSTPT